MHLRPPACGRAGWAADAVLAARKLSLPHLRHWKYTLVAHTCADQGVRRQPGADVFAILVLLYSQLEDSAKTCRSRSATASWCRWRTCWGGSRCAAVSAASWRATFCWTFCHAAAGIPAAPFLLRPVLVRVLGAVSRHPSRGSSPNAQQTVPQCSSNCPSHLPCCSTLACAAVRPGQHVHRSLSAQRTPSNFPLSCSDPCVLQSDLGNISKRCTPQCSSNCPSNHPSCRSTHHLFIAVRPGQHLQRDPQPAGAEHQHERAPQEQAHRAGVCCAQLGMADLPCWAALAMQLWRAWWV